MGNGKSGFPFYKVKSVLETRGGGSCCNNIVSGINATNYAVKNN